MILLPRSAVASPLRLVVRAQQQAVTATSAELKGELLEAINSSKGKIRTGRLPEEVSVAVERIKAAAEAHPLTLTPGAPNGRFELLLNTTNYLDDNACTTLGTLTFQQFKPNDLRLQLHDSEVLTGVDSPTQYVTKSYFTVTECEAEGLQGVQSAIGEYYLDPENPIRQNVFFTGIQIEPGSREPDALAAWLKLLKDANPSMGDDGVALIRFPQRVKGTRDFVFLDDELQVTLGNRGSLVIIRRKE